MLYDDRRYPSDEDIDAGYNGYIVMEFEGANLRVSYFDLNNTLLLTESWNTDAQGKLTGPTFSDVNPALIQNNAAYIQGHSTTMVS